MAANWDPCEFERTLRQLTDESARPFLCHGLPFGCDIFLVGSNPGTDIPFWKHWTAKRGCDKQAWLTDYLAKHGRYGPTRKRIEILFEQLPPGRCVETNAFSAPSSTVSQLSAAQRDSRVFEFLLETMRPRLVFAHGKPAVEHLERGTNLTLPHGAFHKVRYRGIEFEVITGHHHAYQWSDADVKELGAQMAERYRNYR